MMSIIQAVRKFLVEFHSFIDTIIIVDSKIVGDVMELSFILFKNALNTSNLKCNCSSWIDHWKKFSKLSDIKCSHLACQEIGVGAHVKMGSSTKTYIIPLCKKHSEVTDMLRIKTTTVAIDANPTETCKLVRG